MRGVAIALFAMLLGAAALSAQQPSDTTLRRALLERLAEDQAIRDTVSAELRATGTMSEALGRRMLAIDTANTRWLKGIVQERGWPTRAQVGEDGTEAAFLLVQHAVHDLDFMEQMLPLLEQAHRAGDAGGDDVAMLADRIATKRGRKQRYGTQASIVDGRVIIDPIEDSAHVDERRAGVGLPPLADYKRVLDSVFARSSP